ncbi:hypothetical protein [Bradyrhizobium sp.]|uniref:hypothetical protein n=1 Tax=Bradyrhizobium sp. TaxID=376 RepID=UPI003C700D88
MIRSDRDQDVIVFAKLIRAAVPKQPVGTRVSRIYLGERKSMDTKFDMPRRFPEDAVCAQPLRIGRSRMDVINDLMLCGQRGQVARGQQRAQGHPGKAIREIVTPYDS